MPSCLRAFSLVEMMIAIVILGLGLVMVATIFPVAWDRARTLSDYTVEQAASSGAHATLATLLRPAGHSLVGILPHPAPGLPLEELRLTAGSLAGDMFYDPTFPGILPPNKRSLAFLAILAYSDTLVHALNMENIPFINTGPAVVMVAENPWDVEDPGGSFPTPPPTQIVQDRFLNNNYPYPDYQRNRGKAFPDGLFYTPQIRAWQRLYPPMEAPPADPAAPGYQDQLNQWNEKLATRRFCWAVLHRLRSRVGPAPPGPLVQPWQSDELVREAAAAMGSTRTFDMYYVTLRRSRSTNRYARQDPDSTRIPNPFKFVRPVQAVEPAALLSDKDVVFPVAWRVQVQLPKSLRYDTAPPDSGREPTRVPTEIQVPADGIAGNPAALLVSMFPSGTMFVDEIKGHVYRVAKRRIVDANGEMAMLTLDREIVQEDIEIPAGDSRCESCTNTDWTKDPDPEERLRTVWVFPPPVDRTQPGGEQTPTPTFDGPSPVVNIEVATLNVSPS